MNDLIRHILKSIASTTLSLKKKSIFVEKPWALLDDDGEIQKLIFKKDGGLILSKNGKVTEGAWEYYQEAKSILINRGYDKILLNEEFVDQNVLLLRKDGTDNDFFALANQNTLPDLDIPGYLSELRFKELKILELELHEGGSLLVHNALNRKYEDQIIGNSVNFLNQALEEGNMPDGKYLSKDKKNNYYIENGYLSKTSQMQYFQLEKKGLWKLNLQLPISMGI